MGAQRMFAASEDGRSKRGSKRWMLERIKRRKKILEALNECPTSAGEPPPRKEERE